MWPRHAAAMLLLLFAIQQLDTWRFLRLGPSLLFIGFHENGTMHVNHKPNSKKNQKKNQDPSWVLGFWVLRMEGISKGFIERTRGRDDERSRSYKELPKCCLRRNPGSQLTQLEAERAERAMGFDTWSVDICCHHVPGFLHFNMLLQ